jgi:hypothetical protein
MVFRFDLRQLMPVDLSLQGRIAGRRSDRPHNLFLSPREIGEFARTMRALLS